METDTPLDCDYCDLRGEELSLQDISFRRVCGLNAARSAGMTAAQEAGMTKELRRDNLDDKVSPQLLPEKETQDMNIVTPAETHARNHNAASVHRLPHEMLSMIMVDVVDTYGVRFLGRCFTPLTLSQVCQRWRHVALETPQIWRAVYIVQAAPYIRASTPGVTRLQAQAAFMDTCVARAGGLPLDLFFSIDCVSDDVPELLPAWRRYITRCESLCLCFTREVWDAFFDTIVSGPILKELAISGARTSDPLPLQNLVMPRLQSLALDASGQEVIFTGLPEGVNWSQIINLCLEDVEFGHSLATVLNQCTTVKSLRLCIEEFRVEEVCDITLACLEEFTCLIRGLRRENHIQLVLPSFDLPRLRSLSVEEEYSDIPITESVVSMLKRSGCRLETLKLEGTGLLESEEHFDELLKAASGLSSLEIRGSYRLSRSMDNILRCLTRPVDEDSGRYPAPQLEWLVLVTTVNDTESFPSDSSVREVLNMRRLADAPVMLRNANIVAHGPNKRWQWDLFDGGDITGRLADEWV